MYNSAPHSFLDQSFNPFARLSSAFQVWVRREIIDFDPCDDEAVVMRQVLEQFQQTQSSPQS